MKTVYRERGNLNEKDSKLQVGLANHSKNGAAYENAFKQELLLLPLSIALGDFFAYTTEQYKTVEGRNKGFRMAFGAYWERMQETGLYTDDVKKIKRRIEEAGMLGVLSKKLS